MEVIPLVIFLIVIVLLALGITHSNITPPKSPEVGPSYLPTRSRKT
jgi:hypothetical protein